jgi:hypothetical protein
MTLLMFESILSANESVFDEDGNLPNFTEFEKDIIEHIAK